ncbi:MAG TPA: T9SS type A sorting domain-containing protein [Ignavibacteriaceae bacterium]|nr:T9SS type A sorting domain-containing protein [Ignavibacteriaceae bacterium]
MKKLILVLWLIVFVNFAFASDYFVTLTKPPNSDNSGINWTNARAWVDMWTTTNTGITWEKLASGDRVFLDGARSSITYSCSVAISFGNNINNILISTGALSEEPDRHDGDVIITSAINIEGNLIANYLIDFYGNNYTIIEGITFRNCLVAQIRARLSNNCTIRSCILESDITTYPTNNISTASSNNLNILYSSIKKASEGNIYATTCSTLTISNSNFSEAGDYNIKNYNSTNTSISNSIFNDIDGNSDSDANILFDADNYTSNLNCSISNCNINLDGNNGHNSRCISISNAKNSTVSACSIYVTGKSGIKFYNSSCSIIENNYITTEATNSGTGCHQIDCILIGGLGLNDTAVTTDETTIIRNNFLRNSSNCENTDAHDDCIQIYTDIDMDQEIGGIPVRNRGRYYFGPIPKYQIVQIYGNWVEQNGTNDPKNSGIIIGGADAYFQDEDDYDGNPYDSAHYQPDSVFNINQQQGKYLKLNIWSNIFRHYNGTNLLNINSLDPAETRIFNNDFYTATSSSNTGPQFIVYSYWNTNGSKLTTSQVCTLKNFELVNNIFYSVSSDKSLIKYGHYETGKIGGLIFGSNFLSNYNWYYNNGVGNNIILLYSTNIGTNYKWENTDSLITDWKDLGKDLNGGNSDPKFENSALTQPSHFQLDDEGEDQTMVSPCLDYGYHKYDTISPFYKTYDGANRSFYYYDDGNNWDIGAYESEFIPMVPLKVQTFQETLSAYPNPFNPTTTITYVVPKDNKVTLKVFDILGNEVNTLVDEHKQAGTYSVNYIGDNLASGLYFCSFNSGTESTIKKIILLK